MDTSQTLFAFELAASEDAMQPGAEPQAKWKVQAGVAVAGCTDYRFPGNLQAYSQLYGNDRGHYC